MTALKTRISNLEKTAPQPDQGPDIIEIVGPAWNGEPEIKFIFKKHQKEESKNEKVE